MCNPIIIHGSASNTSIKSTSSSAAYAISVATNACCSAVNTSYFSANMCFGALAVVMLLILVAVLLTLVVVL
jgi:hypothetical protein